MKIEKGKKVLVLAIVCIILMGVVLNEIKFSGENFGSIGKSTKYDQSMTFKEWIKDRDVFYNVKIDFGKLKELNPDVCAWIKVPGTNIDYPILQSFEKNDDYYLKYTSLPSK